MAERRPFDPSRIRRPAATSPAAAGVGTPLSVRQVNELVRGVLSTHVPATLLVAGEIGDFARPGSGHLYFTLKDAASELRAVMWRSSAERLRFTPEPGMEVLATGTLDVYTPRGTYQLIVRRLEPRGVGALEVAFRQLRARLEHEGLFDPRRKRPLPRLPKRIAVVTSASGAAVRDVLKTLARRYPIAEVLVWPVRVQGAGAAEEIAAAIAGLNAHAAALGGVDVAIVGRGGGSLEDLWAFNEEIVARAIAASRIPIISAVGHETDVTISDLVADVRAATPTAAAELVAPDAADLRASLDGQVRRATRFVEHALALGRARLAALAARDVLARPRARLRERAQLLDELMLRGRRALADRLHVSRARLSTLAAGRLRAAASAYFAAIARRLADRERRALRGLHQGLVTAERRLMRTLLGARRLDPAQRVTHYRQRAEASLARLAAGLARRIAHGRELLAARLAAVESCSPRSVLARGYSITRDAGTRAIIRSVQQIRDGQHLVTELHDGEFPSTAVDPRQPRLFD